jgi:hypothetical protein
MILKSLCVFSLCLTSIILFNSCIDDDKKVKSAPPIEFISEEDTISLEGARLYLLHGGIYAGTHDYRIYYLTDGFYTNGGSQEGRSLDDYRGASYFLEIRIGVPISKNFVTGKFPQHNDWNQAELSDSNLGFFLFARGTMDDLYGHRTEDSSDDVSPIIINGGIEHGEIMTVRFTGKMRYFHPDDVNPIIKEVKGHFYFEATVIDGRPR